MTTPSPAPGGKPARSGPRPKSARRIARELAVQGLYEWQIGKADSAAIDAHLREQESFAQADAAHLDALLQGCISQAAELDALLSPHMDRRPVELSPVEHAVLWVGTYELAHCVDVPYKVAINESVELAKSFGGTDGHKYVNGVLDKLAPKLRAAEVAAQPRGGRR
ncbi:MAG: hypothetical protein RL722_2979 [Pseudomonadota bacterium]|jgi:N utilization substance protein B